MLDASTLAARTFFALMAQWQRTRLVSERFSVRFRILARSMPVGVMAAREALTFVVFVRIENRQLVWDSVMAARCSLEATVFVRIEVPEQRA